MVVSNRGSMTDTDTAIRHRSTQDILYWWPKIQEFKRWQFGVIALRRPNHLSLCLYFSRKSSLLTFELIINPHSNASFSLWSKDTWCTRQDELVERRASAAALQLCQWWKSIGRILESGNRRVDIVDGLDVQSKEQHHLIFLVAVQCILRSFSCPL